MAVSYSHISLELCACTDFFYVLARDAAGLWSRGGWERFPMVTLGPESSGDNRFVT